MGKLTPLVFDFVQAGTNYPVRLWAEPARGCNGAQYYAMTITVDTGKPAPGGISLRRCDPQELNSDRAFKIANGSFFGPVLKPDRI